MPEVTYCKSPLESKHPSLIKNVVVHDESLDTDSLSPFSNAFYSRIVAIPQCPTDNFFSVGEEHYRLVRPARYQYFWQVHRNAVSLSSFRAVCFRYPTFINAFSDKGCGTPIVLNLTINQNHIGAIRESQVYRREFNPQFRILPLTGNIRLFPHQIALRFDSFEGPVCCRNADAANDCKQSGDNYVCFLPAGSGLLDDDRYLFMGLMWLLCLPPLSLGFYRILSGRRRSGWVLVGGGILLDSLAVSTGVIGCLPWHWRRCLYESNKQQKEYCFHVDKLYHKKFLTSLTFCNTVSGMANVLSTDKQIAVIGALAEGSSIRSIERITGIHRDTIMRLGVRIGKNCELLLDSKMQDLTCNYLQLDEVWGYIGKKEQHCSVDDNPELGDVWTFCAIDSETKLVPSFRVGKRTHEMAHEFIQDIAQRVRNRVQISTDAMNSYPEAIEQAFGAGVDYGQIVKVYVHDSTQHPEHKYSAPSFASAYRRAIAGSPEMELISTSHIERLNATTRLHVKRLNRLTLAFSKKLENFKAAVALHFAYYNFVRRHATLRCTPAMAAGLEKDFWTVGQLVEATS